MSLGGSHPRAETLKTDLKRGLGNSSSSFKTTHGSSEGLGGSGLWRWIGDETGNVYRHKANASCWPRAGERRPHCLDAGLSPLGRNVPGVCYEGMSPTEDIDSGMFPFAVRMASTRPIFFSGLFCFVLLSWINRERERRWFIFLEKQDTVKYCKWQRNRHVSHTIIFIKEPSSTWGRRFHGVALLPSPLLVLSPWPTSLFLWISVSSDGKSGSHTTEWVHCECVAGTVMGLGNWHSSKLDDPYAGYKRLIHSHSQSY